MKRSSSASRVSDKPSSSYSSSSSASQSAVFRSSSVSSGLDSSDLYLPMCNPSSRAAEKERRRLHLAKIFIHFIPVVIVFCAVVLWLFSDPDGSVNDCKTGVFVYDERENRGLISSFYSLIKEIGSGRNGFTILTEG